MTTKMHKDSFCVNFISLFLSLPGERSKWRRLLFSFNVCMSVCLCTLVVYKNSSKMVKAMHFKFDTHVLTQGQSR